jgi:tRNA nucleotidyltransferase/poly(A) polymerase
MENKEMLEKVSNERIGEEIKKILSAHHSDKILLKMEEMGVIESIFKDLSIDLTNTNCSNSLVTLAKILKKNDCKGTELGAKIRDILKFSKKELALIAFLHDYKNVNFETSIESVRRFRVYLSEKQKNAILEYHNPSEFIKKLNETKDIGDTRAPLVDGITLATITGIKPGPKLGMLKGWLYRQQIEKNLTVKEVVLELLDEIDYEDGDYEMWPILSWP